MHAAPELPLTISILPHAAMTMSARRTISSELGVLECTMVTVASRLCNNSAAGVPTTLLRPTTTALMTLCFNTYLSAVAVSARQEVAVETASNR